MSPSQFGHGSGRSFPARAAPQTAHDSPISRKIVGEVPLTELSFRRLRPSDCQAYRGMAEYVRSAVNASAAPSLRHGDRGRPAFEKASPWCVVHRSASYP